jgi:hypothetical protein
MAAMLKIIAAKASYHTLAILCCASWLIILNVDFLLLSTLTAFIVEEVKHAVGLYSGGME